MKPFVTNVTIEGMRVSEALRQGVLAERDELRAENRLLRLRGDTYLEQLQQKHAENERLRAALKRFGNHQMTCSYFRGKERGTCDCGFDKALARPKDGYD
jgi:hypothetical protein